MVEHLFLVPPRSAVVGDDGPSERKAQPCGPFLGLQLSSAPEKLPHFQPRAWG